MLPYILIGLAALVLCLLLLWLAAICGRPRHQKIHTIRGWSYAHRGLHGDGIPENSMAAFRAALEAGYGIELDVHLLSDGGLAVIHDSSLTRTTGAEGIVEDLRTEDLPSYHLEGTGETIPLFKDVLALYAGKAPLVVELKTHGNNAPALCEAACALMDSYLGAYCMESFDPRCLLWLKKHRPDIIRGQLTENWFASKTAGKLPFLLKWILSENLGNFLTKPDFVAYKFDDRRHTLSNRILVERLNGVTWTIRSQADFDTAVEEGWIPIFEGFRPDPTRRPGN